MKTCELCKSPARIYCESDQASLCCDCDAKVHSANFLVAKHSRTLLCHVCQSPTPWNASGPKLGPTVSVCEKCVNSCNSSGETSKRRVDNESDRDEDDDNDSDESGDGGDDEDDGNNDEDDDENDGDGGEDDEDEENQVVPWSSTPPPPVSSSSTSEESSSKLYGGREGISESKIVKRARDNAELSSQENQGCSSSQQNLNLSLSNEALDYNIRPLKARKRTVMTTGSGSKALIDALKKLQHQTTAAGDKSVTILGVCKLSKGPGVGHGVSTD